MDHFHYRNRALFCEEVPVKTLAETYGTPVWIYSKSTLLHHYNQLKRAFAAVQPLICYSIKTNPNLSICRLMGEAGAGFDVTSAGELYRALAAGGKGDKIVFEANGSEGLATVNPDGAGEFLPDILECREWQVAIVSVPRNLVEVFLSVVVPCIFTLIQVVVTYPVDRSFNSTP